MCRFTHPLAAIGTISWPHFQVQRPQRSPSIDLHGQIWNHPMAETAGLEASIGQGRVTARIHKHDKSVD